jgi:glycosyltransferase involved in cell wall biosynthesis
MDKANLALAQYLVEQEVPVHLVAYSVAADIAKHPLVTVHPVPRPAASYFLGRPLLDLIGRKVARQTTKKWPGARVVVNGGNCIWPDINWFHYVHHAWRPRQHQAPLWFRAKEALNQGLSQRQERSAAQYARVIISNSKRTSRDLINHLGADPQKVHTVYLGAESEWSPVSTEERAASREFLAISGRRPVAVFLGSLSFDFRKGFDVLVKAWKKLCAEPNWDVDLLVAGSGNAFKMFREQVSLFALDNRIRMLGFTNQVQRLLAAADLLISPVRYEAYGLNVQEAICRGIPSIVSVEAGIAERYGTEIAPLLLADPEDVDGLVKTLWRWRSDMVSIKVRFDLLGEELRAYGWREMSSRITSIAWQEGPRRWEA